MKIKCKQEVKPLCISWPIVGAQYTLDFSLLHSTFLSRQIPIWVIKIIFRDIYPIVYDDKSSDDIHLH